MYIQDFVYSLEDQNTPITVVAESTKETIETNAYLLKRLLYIAQKLSADNIEIVVNEDDFTAIKKYLNR